MFRYEDVSIRKFCADDISYKVEWINNNQNNQFLHYDLPLTENKTATWYEKIKTGKTDGMLLFCITESR